jgi:DNA sulfur modification protein DndE
MALSLIEVSTAQFRTTRSADKQCEELLRRLGYKVHYLVARLALARSLALLEQPAFSADEEDDPGRTIRGQQLFGDGPDLSAWVALLVQRVGKPDITRRDVQAAVTAHWRRGADLLTKDWDEVQGSLPRFIEKLSDLASLPEEHGRLPLIDGDEPIITAGVVIPVGEVAEDADTQEPVAFPVNAAGGSPHIAFMGGAGSGKTRTAAMMLKRLRSFGAIPFLAFDFKGDLVTTYGLDTAFGAQVISPPRTAIPLDVLAVSDSDDIGMAAVRVRESIGRVKQRALSGVQADALRDAVTQALRTQHPATLSHISRALTAEYNRRNRRPDELTATLNDLTQFTLFEPRYSPAEFFQRSWLINLPPDIPSDVRRLVTNLTLDSLDRWINSLPEAQLLDGRRSLRHVCLVDEAHLILASGLPALGNLVRMSRSKGGLIVLVSQSPNDFENEDDAFLDNVGLTVAFNTNARPGPTARIFGRGASLTTLMPGEALCGIRIEAKTRRIIAWKP